MRNVHNIVVACDGSRHAGQAAALAGTLSQALGATLHLVHVFPGSVAELVGMPGASAQMLGLARFEQRDLDALAEESARDAFAVAEQALGAMAASVVRQRLAGDPANELVAYAHGLDAPLLVLGPRGRGYVGELLLGSVTHSVLHKARCPVLVAH